MTEILEMKLLPPAKHLCQQCARKHEPWDAHDATTMFYQMWFFQKHGRLPTWKDAVAHCEPSRASAWEKELRARGVWSAPEEALGKLPVVISERQQEETPVTPILMYGEGFSPSEGV